MSAKPKAPKGCFWKGGVLWGRVRLTGQPARKWSLNTADPETARVRRMADVGVLDLVGLKRRLAASPALTANELTFVLNAIDAQVIALRRGGGDLNGYPIPGPIGGRKKLKRTGPKVGPLTCKNAT